MIYLAHYGMSEAPFGLTPNTAFYVDLPIHQQAMAVLTVALAQGEGFIKVTGEVGTGKTLLCRKLLQEAPDNFALAYVPDPNLSPLELRWALALELGLKHSANIDPQQLTQLLQRQLVLLAQQQKQVVLLIDEAQALPDETLEALRLLTNLETEQRKLLQVVLFGQPELNQRLALYQFRQLRQRISFSYDLSVLNRAQVACYVRARLQLAGVARPVFSQASLWLLHFYSRGIPRLINMLAHKALMLGFGKNKQQLGCAEIMYAARDTDDVLQLKFWWPVFVSALLLLGYYLPGVLGMLGVRW
jgi:MSHA biogenesis protein MshM